ncbi:Trp biosynthesis-associated membrane protein [Nonomuraea sp. 3-1Str]|uniref:Trp biosynthesis-associated membrane protein n=1 Tax=Nonomuraea sp. 3-1Str TaxID=2929801 RepID=UPI00285D89D6|nr:Trp biosynthesis-associated membrane protein [Nonomuraea sp. 3-1Str]MDR8409551.1 Trp biosynthesis-associated membrane protein [Nonomuraea sp. 3-1Str]
MTGPHDPGHGDAARAAEPSQAAHAPATPEAAGDHAAPEADARDREPLETTRASGSQDAAGAPPASPRARGRGRELWRWVALTAAGCALVLFAATRAWITVRAGHATGVPGGAGADPVTPSGGDLAPVLTPLALAGLAGVVAALASKGLTRRLVGALLTLCGLGAGLATWLAVAGDAPTVWLREHDALRGLGSFTWDVVAAWPALSAVGAALMVAGGVLAAVRGPRWAGMSDRYERTPAAGRPRVSDDRALWDALDRGDDPT